MIIPSLLLQKPFKTSKTKDHVKALERRLEFWKKGRIEELVVESQAVQNLLPDFSNPKNVGEISKKFVKGTKKGNTNGALKILTDKMKNGILPLNEQTLKTLRQNIQGQKLLPIKYCYQTSRGRFILYFSKVLQLKSSKKLQ